SGKAPKQLPKKIEDRFVALVKESSDPDNGAAFLSRSYRKVCHFHKVLEYEFECKIDIRRLYKAKKDNGLLKYFDRPDFDEDDVQKNNNRFFKSEEVLALVQMDGSWCKSFKIKKGEGYKQPIVITLFDTGSRCVLAKEFYFSESSENSIDVLIRWLKQPLPKQKIKFRPDNAGGFLNTNRAFQEINYKYSEKGGFVFDFNPAHVYSPKEKVHIERQYGEFRTFEAWVQERLKDRYVKMESGFVDVNGRKEHRRLKCYDITLEEIQDRKIIDEYIRSYNGREHRFTENGVQKKWVPDERMAAYMEGKELIQIEKDILDKLVQYGMKKMMARCEKRAILHIRSGNGW
ncbi:MAG: integrase family protein (integrase domain protein), partial [Candidatus Magnetoglobus multicellularis str. Araruama]